MGNVVTGCLMWIFVSATFHGWNQPDISSQPFAQFKAEVATRERTCDKRPRRRAIGMRPEYRFVQYIEDWRLKIERVALTYPEEKWNGMYDSLILTVSIRRDGTIEEIKLDRPSKYQALNDAVVQIIRKAAPYAPFPPEIARDTDILDITRALTFTKGKR